MKYSVSWHYKRKHKKVWECIWVAVFPDGSCPGSQACPWECHSYGNPVGNVPWDGTGINCYGMEMGQINMSHGQR